MTTTPKNCVTHSGPFHADDLVAYVVLFMLGLVGRLVRTRDPKEIAAGEIVFDVGTVYDHATGRYDHHQRGGAGARPNGVPFASAGLVWRHYGEQLCASYATLHGIDGAALAAAIDESVVQGVDALDCGATEGGYKLKGTDTDVHVQSLSAVASAFNPASLVDSDSPADFDRAFLAAADALRPIFERMLLGEVSRLKGIGVVKACDTGAAVMVLEPFCPWQETVVTTMPHVLFVVFRNPEGTWMVQVVPAALGSFDARKSLPAAWAGLRDAALADLTGVADSVFCHPGKFICGAKSKEGALRLAELAQQA